MKGGVIVININYKNDLIDKISSNVHYICNGLVLKHVVSLGRKDEKDRKRKYYYSEYMYKINKYTDYNELISVKIDLNSYLLLEMTGKDFSDKENVYLNNKGLSLFKHTVLDVVKWFKSESFKDLYFIDINNKLIFNSDYNDLKSKVYINGKTLIFKPTIINIDGDDYEGVYLYLNKERNKYQLLIDDIISLYDTLKDFNLYLSGLTLLNIVGRPLNDYYLHKINMKGENQRKNEKIITKGLQTRRRIGESNINLLDGLYGTTRYYNIKF